MSYANASWRITSRAVTTGAEVIAASPRTISAASMRLLVRGIPAEHLAGVLLGKHRRPRGVAGRDTVELSHEEPVAAIAVGDDLGMGGCETRRSSSGEEERLVRDEMGELRRVQLEAPIVVRTSSTRGP